MQEVNFCPYCDASQHKISRMPDEDLYFCRSCNNFFELKGVKYKCFKCGSTRMEDSEFPSPSGEIVFQCRKCRKMYSYSEFIEKNERLDN